MQFFQMGSRIIMLTFHIFLSLEFYPSKAQTWVQTGYYLHPSPELPIADINSSLFTHLICGCADVNSTSYKLFVLPSGEKVFSTFTDTVKQKNTSVTTLLSIGCAIQDYSIISSMVSNSSYRRSFIDSSILTARLYGFQGLDFWFLPSTSSDMINMGVLFGEWRAAIDSEARNSGKSQLILTAAVYYRPYMDSASAINYPIDSIQQHLDWVQVMSYRYSQPTWSNFTNVHAALYGSSSVVNTDNGVRAWMEGGLSANKLVLGLPFFGFAWKLVKSMDNGIGAPAMGPALTPDGSVAYKDIKNYIERYEVIYNATYVVNYFTMADSWINFDGEEVVRTKVSYAKEKKLLGYHVWQLSQDVDWVLSKAAAHHQEDKNNSSAHQEDRNNTPAHREDRNNTSAHQEDRNNSSAQDNNKSTMRQLLIIILTTIAAVILLLGSVIYIFYRWITKLKLKGTMNSAERSKVKVNDPASSGDLNRSSPSLIVYNLAEIETATERFSIKNKLGEGGYGPVYKGILPDGQEIAVKKLSKASTQGFEEFKNEVMLTAKLQHVNLVRLLGFCIDGEEHMLIYEYMPNKSLDYYLFDAIRKLHLDWRKRIHVIEGVSQGLLYLQEYSRLTIIHRDLKSSNILLDEDMKPKISDFGMARIFGKKDLHANTGRIVGTYGYVPPEYVLRGIYSTKSDVYGFGVLLLEIISGKKVSFLYGLRENLGLLDDAYELWKDGKGMEFMDLSLDDTNTTCKLMRCLQVALLCVQEDPNDRPSMLEVSSMLKNESTDMMIPKKPAFSKQIVDNDMRSKSTQQSSEICSVNDVTFSDQVVAR